MLVPNSAFGFGQVYTWQAITSNSRAVSTGLESSTALFRLFFADFLARFVMTDNIDEIGEYGISRICGTIT